MATAAVDTDSTSCGFCLQRVAYMEDPRELDCGHVYCMPCLVGDYTKMGVTDCVICGKTHSKENVLDSLSQYEARVPPTANVAPKKVFKCGFCDDAMVTYCMECEIKLCESHAKDHEKSQKMFFKTTHKMVGAVAYSASPKKFEQRSCATHMENKLSAACQTCYTMFCEKCERKPCSDGSTHHEVDIKSLTHQIQQQYETLLKGVANRVSKIGQVDKRSWSILEDKEQLIAEMLVKVDQTTEKRIQSIKTENESIKNKITEALTHDTQSVVTFVSELTEEREELNEMWSDTKRHLTYSHDVDIVKEFIERTRMLKKSTEADHKDDLELLYVNLKEEDKYVLDVSIASKLPKALTFKAEHSRGDPRSVCWMRSGVLVVGTSSTLGLLDENLKQLPSSLTGNINANSLTSIDEKTILALGYQTTITIAGFDSSLNKIGSPPLSQYSSGGNSDYIHLTVATNIIMSLDAHNKQLRRFKLDGGEISPISLASMTKPRGVASLNCESVLVTDHCENGAIHNYSLDPAVKTPLWTCSGITSPTGITVDERRELIYTAGLSNATVYVISKQGKLLAELKLSGSCTSVFDVSVMNDRLAVADNSKGVKLYEIKYGLS